MRHLQVMAIVRPGETLGGLMQRFHKFEETAKVDQHVATFFRMGYATKCYRAGVEEVAISERTGACLPRGHWSLGKGALPPRWKRETAPSEAVLTLQEHTERLFPHLPYKEKGEKADLFGVHRWGWLAHQDGVLDDVVVRTNPRGRWAKWHAVESKQNGATVWELDVAKAKARRRGERKRKLDQLLKECQGAGYQAGEALSLWKGYVEAGGAKKAEEKFEEAGGRIHLGQDLVSWLVKQSDPELAPIKAAVETKVAIILAETVPEGVVDPPSWARRAPAVACSAIVWGPDWWEDNDVARWEGTVTQILERASLDSRLYFLRVETP